MPNDTNRQKKDVKIRTHNNLIFRSITITRSRLFLTKIYETDVLQKGPISFIGLQISVIICVTCFYLSNIKYLLSISLKIAITHKMCFKEVFYYKVMISYQIIMTRFMRHGSKFSLNYCCDLCLVQGPSVVSPSVSILYRDPLDMV